MKSQYKQRMDACEDRRIQFELKQGDDFDDDCVVVDDDDDDGDDCVDD